MTIPVNTVVMTYKSNVLNACIIQTLDKVTLVQCNTIVGRCSSGVVCRVTSSSAHVYKHIFHVGNSLPELFRSLWTTIIYRQISVWCHETLMWFTIDLITRQYRRVQPNHWRLSWSSCSGSSASAPYLLFGQMLNLVAKPSFIIGWRTSLCHQGRTLIMAIRLLAKFGKDCKAI